MQCSAVEGRGLQHEAGAIQPQRLLLRVSVGQDPGALSQCTTPMANIVSFGHLQDRKLQYLLLLPTAEVRGCGECHQG